MNKFSYLRPGDFVMRNLAGQEMKMVVVAVKDSLVYCDAHPERPLLNSRTPLDEHWKFDVATGAEEDADLGWGVKYGRSGSSLVPEKMDA